MRTKLPFTALFVALGAGPLLGQTQPEFRNFISVSSTGKVKAKPDVCVAVLEVRSAAPLAADALQQNEKKASEVAAKLKELGVEGEGIRFSGNQFTPSGGGRVYMPGGQRPTGFEVYNVIEVRMKNPDLSNFEAISKKVATLLDELGKIGAGILPPDLSRFSMGGSSAVYFAVERAEEYEKQAYEKAIERARPIAEEIAKKMGVKVTGIHSVQSTGGVTAPRPPGGYEFEFSHFASSPEDLAVRATVVVNFSFK
jgi:uncharacterized protein YggE